MSGDDGTVIGVTAIYGAQTSRGLVELTINERGITVPPAKAREIAVMLLEAAASAEGDEILMRVLEQGGMSRQRASWVLMAMRQERQIVERRARAELRKAIAEDAVDLDDPEGS